MFHICTFTPHYIDICLFIEIFLFISTNFLSEAINDNAYLIIPLIRKVKQYKNYTQNLYLCKKEAII